MVHIHIKVHIKVCIKARIEVRIEVRIKVRIEVRIEVRTEVRIEVRISRLEFPERLKRCRGERPCPALPWASPAAVPVYKVVLDFHKFFTG